MHFDHSARENITIYGKNWFSRRINYKIVRFENDKYERKCMNNLYIWAVVQPFESIRGVRCLPENFNYSGMVSRTISYVQALVHKMLQIFSDNECFRVWVIK